MQLVADDLLCTSCQGYVHLFLSCCPACGTERVGRFGAAVATGSLGARALLGDEATAHAARSSVIQYSLRSRGAPETDDLASAFEIVAGSIQYHASVAADAPTPALPAGSTTLDGANVRLAQGTLQVRAGTSGRAIAEVPLGGILAATPIVKGAPAAAAWAGVTLGSRRLLPQRLLPAGDLLVTFSGAGGPGQLALANRRSLLAPKARPDHYGTLALWLGMLAAATAEDRWQAVGPAAYAAELGLGDPVGDETTPAAEAASTAGAGAEGAIGGATAIPQTAAASSDRPVAAPASSAAASPQVPGVRAALEELEDLRAAGLVTAEEYEAKRREILARL
jgi:hypothetical protein